ncbi:MAG: HEAT repeat domain-containing protein, partial [Planctomycetota bacterium]
DLKAPTVAAVLPAGWIAFKDRPPEVEEDDDDDDGPRVARKDIKDHLLLTLETDKDTYLLHEPIELTLTLTSITDANIQLESSRTLRFDMDCNDDSKDIECAVGPYEPNVETIVLGPWKSISTTDTLEIALVGDYKIRCEYGRFEDPWQGDVEDDVAFRVNPVGSSDEEQQLFQAKFSRLTAKLRRELSSENYDWSWVDALVRDEVVGMAGMGPNVAPYITEALKVEESEDVRGRLCQVLKPFAGPEYLPFLTEALKTEENGNVREELYRLLTPLAGPEYLPFFQDRLAHLAHGAEDESGPVCGWLYDLYRKGQDGSAQALATLLSAMNHKNGDVRRVVAEHLKSLYDPNVEACFEKALDDENEEVRIIAASYLAAAEWLNLDEWLDVAARKPTKARYLAARSIIKRIEEHWNITKGELPGASWEEASKSLETLEQYRKVVQAWQKWASEHLRYSSAFFGRDWEHWLKKPSS